MKKASVEAANPESNPEESRPEGTKKGGWAG